MKVLLAAAEISPLVRTGGLGEAVAGLARALVALGLDVTVAIPGYGTKAGKALWKEIDLDGVDVAMFLDGRFDRPGVYGPRAGTGYEDNWERFGVFSRAVAELSSSFDILHLNDSHVGPAALKASVPTVFTIHNASYALLGPLDETTSILGLTHVDAALGGPIEWYGEASFLKAGIVGADQVTTVSPTHARELTQDPTGFGLAGVIRDLRSPIIGILNGIDTDLWNPATDPALEATFSAQDPRSRVGNRLALLAELRIDDGFLLGNVGRMAMQKGLQLLDYDIDSLVEEGHRFVFVGNGELDPVIDGWAARHRRAIVHRPFTEELARRVFAGVDAYLMPSEYEPCGLGQMYAMRYGAPPIAHAVGGLADSVIDIDEDARAGTGFVFRSFHNASLTKTIRRAGRYRTSMPEVWASAVAHGMSADWSWAPSAARYVELYREVATVR